jgi:hypothetical protein
VLRDPEGPECGPSLTPGVSRGMAINLDFTHDKTTAIRNLAEASIPLGTVEKTGYKGKEKVPVGIRFGALYFPDLCLLTVFWSVVSGYSEEGLQARTEFVPWDGGFPVYRRVEGLRLEAIQWAKEGGIKLDSEGRYRLNPFTWDDPFPG